MRFRTPQDPINSQVSCIVLWAFYTCHEMGQLMSARIARCEKRGRQGGLLAGRASDQAIASPAIRLVRNDDPTDVSIFKAFICCQMCSFK
jgi:hypothetical protein